MIAKPGRIIGKSAEIIRAYGWRYFFARARHKLFADKRPLKILIVSTPKTGNTWLQALLSAIYDLPLVDFELPFNPKSADRLGERWISHQHYPLAEPGLLAWAEANGVVLLSTIRHPGDVLVSLAHYVRNYIGEKEFWHEALLAQDAQLFGPNALAYVESYFPHYLDVSIQWVQSGKAHPVRYEDLIDSPLGVLCKLTQAIRPVPIARLRQAIAACDIDALRKQAGGNRKFFRQGRAGQWRRELPPALVELLATRDPYPAQFAALGYSLDAGDAARQPATAEAPADTP